MTINVTGIGSMWNRVGVCVSKNSKKRAHTLNGAIALSSTIVRQISGPNSDRAVHTSKYEDENRQSALYLTYITRERPGNGMDGWVGQ